MNMSLVDVPSPFIYRTLALAVAIIVILPLAINAFPVNSAASDSPDYQDLLETYGDWTGASSTAGDVNFWALSGIYTPWGVNANGEADLTASLMLPDMWMAGARISAYSPSQYDTAFNGSLNYSVNYDADTGTYRYAADYPNLGVKSGDLYAAVDLSVEQKSQYFLTSGDKSTNSNGYFTYKFTGYRYAFSPTSDYTYTDGTTINHNSSSLSLIYYQYYTDSGICGQLVINSSADETINYITSDMIVYAFDGSSNLATFPMKFNGVEFTVYLRMSPYAIAAGFSPEECYNLGYWSVMVSTPSQTASTDLLNTNAFNVSNVLDTMWDLLTFNATDYGLTGTAATLASIAFSIPLYVAMIVIGLSCWPVLIMAGIMAAIQGITSFGILP